MELMLYILFFCDPLLYSVDNANNSVVSFVFHEKRRERFFQREYNNSALRHTIRIKSCVRVHFRVARKILSV